MCLLGACDMAGFAVLWFINDTCHLQPAHLGLAAAGIDVSLRKQRNKSEQSIVHITFYSP